MEYVTMLGLAAAFLTTFSFLPQLAKAWKTKSTNDISSGWLAMVASGIFLWLVYGLAIEDIPLIFANIITLSFIFILSFFKFKYG